MSYDRVNPTFYQTFQPDTPFHPGAEGWTQAPWPTWGDNPNLAGRRRLATDGLGNIIAVSGLGAVNLGPAPTTIEHVGPKTALVAAAALGAAGYAAARYRKAKSPATFAAIGAIAGMAWGLRGVDLKTITW